MNKKVLIGIGVLAVIGIAYYVYTSSKTEDGGSGSGSGTNDALKSGTGAKPLLTRKDKRQACGFKPLFNKEKKALYQQCVDAGGVASFDGDDGL